MKKKVLEWKPTRVSAMARAIVTIRFECPVCEKKQEATLENAQIVGGCTGHGEGDYCYCDSPHYEEVTKCIQCGVTVELQTGY